MAVNTPIENLLNHHVLNTVVDDDGNVIEGSAFDTEPNLDWLT